jgi:branched-chain amino acid transport system substrate-binding protein
MTSTLGNPSEVPSSPLFFQNSPSESNCTASFPRASQLFEEKSASEGEEAERAPDEQTDAIAHPSAAEFHEQGSGSEGEEEAEKATDEQNDAADRPWPRQLVSSTSAPVIKSSSRRGRFGLAAGLAVGVAVALIIGPITPIHDAPDREFALVAAAPVAQVSPTAADQPIAGVDQSVAGADEAQAAPANWSERAAQLQYLAPAPTASADAAPTLTTAGDPASVAPANAATPTPAPLGAADNAVRGLTDKEIRFGMVAPFSGASRELGRQMKIGVETAFDQINEAGGVNGRQLHLVTADDGYEPTRTLDAMRQLYEKDQVFGFIGNVGTPTAAVALPYALDRRSLFFGAFSGADLLRRDPPDRYVFNYRASYGEETDAVVRYLVKVRRIPPRDIMVFAQEDAFGDSGYAGVAKAMRALPGNTPEIVRVGYKRNTVDVQDAVTRLRAYKGQIKAVVMVASYRAAAKFIEKTRDLYPSLIYTNVSFVGSTSLADELMLLGPRYAAGVVVTQVVPAVNSYASIILKYKAALAKYFPGEAADYVSLEGYIDACILAEAIRRVGPQIDTEKLVDQLEQLHDFDMGLGTQLSFSADDHQGSHKVWGSQLDESGHYQALDLQ